MKNIIKIAVVAIVVSFLSTSVLMAQEHNHAHKKDKNMGSEMMMKMKKIDKNKDGYVYECPMKCETAKDAPGECSKCGMTLKKISIKDMSMHKMTDKKMKHKKNMKENKKMMETKMKGMNNMKMTPKGKMKMKTLETK